MVQINCKSSSAYCTRTEQLTSGTVGTVCHFIFDETWDGLAKTAVFKAGNMQRDVMLTEDQCNIPWEVLRYSGYKLTVGVYGTNGNGTVVIPTVYATVGDILDGADPCGEESAAPTPALVEQILGAASTAVATANAVRAEANAGAFNGEQGPKGDAGADGHTPEKGVDYWTEADVAELAQDLTHQIDVPSQLSQLGSDASHRTVSDEEKSAWNGKQDRLTAGTDYATPSQLAFYMPKSGGAFTGNVSGKYITAAWLQSTDHTNLNSAPNTYPVFDGSGWLYSRTRAEMQADLGVTNLDNQISTMLQAIANGSY